MTFEEMCGDHRNHIELYTVGTGPKRFIKLVLTRDGLEPVYVARGKTIAQACDNVLNQIGEAYDL